LSSRSVFLQAVESETLKRRETEDGPTDLDLMRRIVDGERNALAALYARHGGVALAFARRMLEDEHHAEEAVQDAFVSVWRRAATFRSEAASPRTWLLAIVRNRCIDSLRRRRGDAATAALDEAQPEAFDDELWPEIWKRECGAAVRSALRDLPPEQREVIELGFYGGYSHAQIAERLSLPLGTLKKRMRSGLKRLRAALDESYSRSA
jgi:RNA polymerase sigma-70 factor (ECF subfamily)